jgi:FO synthase
MAHWPEPDRGEMLRTLAVARLLMPKMNIQAPPNLSDPHYADLLDGGINDWGGVSPLTPDFINPEKPWPHLEELRQRTEAKGFELHQRLPVYPEFARKSEKEFAEHAAAHSSLLAQRLNAAADAEGYARRVA